MNKLFLGIGVFAAALLFTAPAAADYGAGLQKYRAGDISGAESIWKKGAEGGDVRSQYALGLSLFRKAESDDDFRASARWMLQARKANHPRAMYYLALMKISGKGLRRDFFGAADLLKNSYRRTKAPSAAFVIGLLHFTGRGVQKSYIQAAAWFKKAAETGHRTAQYMLGSQYKRGWGIPQDMEKAYGWMALSIIEGYDLRLPDGFETLKINPKAVVSDVRDELTPQQQENAMNFVNTWRPKQRD